MAMGKSPWFNPEKWREPWEKDNFREEVGMASELKWSEVVPAEPGWYWWRQDEGGSVHPLFSTPYSKGGQWWPERIKEPE